MQIDSHTLFEYLCDAPDAALILHRIQDRLEAENRRRIEFYNEINESLKAEFINGDIVLHSPVTRAHSLAVSKISRWLGNYVEEKRLGEVHIEKALIRLTRNDYEPDICFFGNAKAKEFTADQKLFPPPDLVVEVLSPSTEKIDRGIKFHDYAAHDIAESWIVDTNEKFVEQYVLRNGQYELVIRSRQNDLHADSVDGFVLPVRLLFEEI
ncbi:MAG: hypothetical protein RL742_179 [Bacteroidota bacterium]